MRDTLLGAIVIGMGATAFMDLVAWTRKQVFGTPSADYALVGRWIAYMPRGRFLHRPIAASPCLHGERAVGWSTHYLIGIAFAFLLLTIFGAGQPAVLPALITGIGSVAAPFLLMQPGMGLGIAACRAPKPNAARLRSLAAHLTFGIGLYLAGWAANRLGFIN
ncbi:MAG: DUF2938 domain-containing protein [Pseudomonadota bacterium]